MEAAVDEMQQRLTAIAALLAKAEVLAAQVEKGEKSLVVMPTILGHIEAAHRLAAVKAVCAGDAGSVLKESR